MNCTKADPFEYLTFELLIKICGYLDNDSLYNLGFVCKSSRNIVLHPFLKLVWYSFIFNHVYIIHKIYRKKDY